MQEGRNRRCDYVRSFDSSVKNCEKKRVLISGENRMRACRKSSRGKTLIYICPPGGIERIYVTTLRCRCTILAVDLRYTFLNVLK